MKLRDYLVTVSVQFVIQAKDREDAEFTGRCCIPGPVSTHPRNAELENVYVEAVEDITDEA